MNYKNKTKILIVKIIEYITYVIWDLSGLRFIYRKLKPLANEIEDNPKYRKPSTFFLWTLGIYIAAFGFASQKYEDKLDRAEHKVNHLMTQLSTKYYKEALLTIPRLEKSKCPNKPYLFDPYTVFKSIFHENIICQDITIVLKEIVEFWKNDLNDLSLNGINLVGTELKKANFKNSILIGINFENSNLYLSDFTNASLYRANLKKTNLTKAILDNTLLSEADISYAKLDYIYAIDSDFSKAILKEANLHKSKFVGSNFQYTILEGANLSETKFENVYFKGAKLKNVDFKYARFFMNHDLTYDQLKEVQSLYKVEGLDIKLENKLRKHHPYLFERR